MEQDLNELQNDYAKLLEVVAKQQKKMDMLENILNVVVRPDRYVFERPISAGATGLRVGQTGQKLGFLGVTPSILITPTGRQDKSGSGGANVTDGTGYDGNTGTSYFTIGDIVYALKTLGLLKQ